MIATRRAAPCPYGHDADALTRDMPARSDFAAIAETRGLDTVDAAEFDAVFFPAATASSSIVDDERVHTLVRAFHERGAPIAAVCHGPAALVRVRDADGRAFDPRSAHQRLHARRRSRDGHPHPLRARRGVGRCRRDLRKRARWQPTSWSTDSGSPARTRVGGGGWRGLARPRLSTRRAWRGPVAARGTVAPLDRLEREPRVASPNDPPTSRARRDASFARVARGGTLATRVVRWGIERAAQSRLGAYELREQIGEGGFARVFRATGPQGEVAVKVLGSTGLDDASLRRFEREIDVLAKVRHPSLVSLLDSGIDDTHGPFLVMPSLVGLTFRDVLPATGLGPEGGIRLLTPVVQALGAMHAAGLVHRDLKPENVIVSPRGEVTLVDLGLALGLGQSRLTQAGAVAGSLPYMAPEQIDGDARTQSDV
ncbi:MAG: protein kinase [Sandaracinus sp.]|nr:protein kinase [Sandaracinus sp.]